MEGRRREDFEGAIRCCFFLLRLKGLEHALGVWEGAFAWGRLGSAGLGNRNGSMLRTAVDRRG